MANAGRSRIGLLGILFALVIIFAIIAGNAYVYLSFQSNPNQFSGLANNAANFPTGLVATIFSPDSTVLNGSQTFADWYAGFAIAVVVFFLVFLITNLDVEAREIGFRSILYGLMLILIPIGSNAFSLLASQSSVGPSSVTFASIGLVLGFGILNAGIWVERDGPRLRNGRELLSITISIAIVVGLISVALVSPVTFFNTDPINKADWIGHVFCYVIGAVAPVWFHSMRES